MIARGLDIDTAQFCDTSGATDAAKLDTIVRYLKRENLWNDVRCYPMKSSQNAGSGATVYGFGGWTANNISLVNSPTWGSDGLALNGSSQYGSVTLTGVQSTSAFKCINRIKPTNASAADTSHGTVWHVGDSGAAQKFVYQASGTSLLTAETWTFVFNDGTTGRRAGTNNITWSAGEDFTEVTETNTRALWKNKTSIALNLLASDANNLSPSATTTTSDVVYIGATSISTGYFNGKFAFHLFFKGSWTTAQRETLTDLVNAL